MKSGTLQITYVLVPPFPAPIQEMLVGETLKDGEWIESVWPVESLMNHVAKIEVLAF